MEIWIDKEGKANVIRLPRSLSAWRDDLKQEMERLEDIAINIMDELQITVDPRPEKVLEERLYDIMGEIGILEKQYTTICNVIEEKVQNENNTPI